MARIKHTHKYKRRNLGNNFIVYYCVLPNCTHHHSALALEGKYTICWSCNKEIVLTKRQLKQSKPHCLPKCQPKLFDETENILNKLLESARK